MPPRAGPPRFRQQVLPALALCALTLAVFRPVAGHEFVEFDDDKYVTDNPVVRRGLSRAGVVWAFATMREGNWHPVSWLSHMLDVQLFGLNAGAHHLVSLAVHAANAVLVFLLLRALTGRQAAGALVAALFAVHPLHVEPVAWVAERKELLGTFFGLLAVLAWLRPLRDPAASRAPAAVLYAAGLAAKPSIVALPLLLAILDFWPLGRRPSARLLREKWPLILLAVAAGAVAVVAQQRGGNVVPLAQISLGERVWNAVAAGGAYVAKAVAPVRLAVYYPHPGAALPPWRPAAALALLAAVTWCCLRFRRERPHLLAGWLWFLAGLLPVAGLVQVGEQAMADRYVYLPLTGLFVMAVWSLPVARPRRPRRTVPAVAAAALLAFGILARRQVHVWRDSPTLYRHAVAVTGENWLMEYDLGVSLYRRGDDAGAAGHLAAAARLRPYDWQGRYLLGNALLRLGRAEEAVRELERAVALRPGASQAHNNLGAALLGLGREDEARARFAEAVRLDPGNAEAHANLGWALERRGERAEAIGHYRRALELRPGFPAAAALLERALERAADEAGPGGVRPPPGP